MGAIGRVLAVLGVGFCVVLMGAKERSPLVGQPTADQVLGQAEATAKSEHKKILLVFSASWCGPCHELEKFLEDPQVHPVMDRSFVTAHLDVLERPKDTLHASSPGGELELAKLSGGGTGVPYFAMLDEDGNWITDSKMPGDDGPPVNVGYPARLDEINWFMHMVKKAAPDMPAEDTKILRDFLGKHGSL